MFRPILTFALCAIAGTASAQAAAPPPPDELRQTSPQAEPGTDPRAPPPSLSSILVAGDWTVAVQNADLVMFVKPATPALGPEGFRRISVRFEFAAPQTSAGPKAYQSMLVLTEFDCAHNRSRNIQATAFSSHNLATPQGPPQEGQGDWTPVESGSIAGILQKQACPGG